ncbi:hypothetical protein ACNTMW_23350 [Planosporangium sp. 12N6]|uniref:hypothetical protein n=1 Tax=Planosporangium spinosum TaxID=3402278 RepID=UPI003CEDB8D1
MRTKLRQCLVAASLAVTVAVAGTAQPAHAAAPTIDWTALIINIATKLIGSGGGGVSSGELNAAVQQVVGAVGAAKTEILNHIDAIASAEVQSCARHHAIEFTDINNMNAAVLQSWAQDATACATKATSYVTAVQSAKAAGDIGFLLGEIYAIAVAARTKAGLVNGIDYLIRDQVRAYDVVVTKTAPQCKTIWYTWGDPVYTWYSEVTYTCTAYDGERVGATEYWYGSQIEQPIDYAWVESYSCRNTSRPIAIDAIPRLRAIVP